MSESSIFHSSIPNTQSKKKKRIDTGSDIKICKREKCQIPWQRFWPIACDDCHHILSQSFKGVQNFDNFVISQLNFWTLSPIGTKHRRRVRKMSRKKTWVNIKTLSHLLQQSFITSKYLNCLLRLGFGRTHSYTTFFLHFFCWRLVSYVFIKRCELSKRTQNQTRHQLSFEVGWMDKKSAIQQRMSPLWMCFP